MFDDLFQYIDLRLLFVSTKLARLHNGIRLILSVSGSGEGARCPPSFHPPSQLLLRAQVCVPKWQTSPGGILMNGPSACFSVKTRRELPTASRLEGLSDDLFRERTTYKKLNGLSLGILSLLEISLSLSTPTYPPHSFLILSPLPPPLSQNAFLHRLLCPLLRCCGFGRCR